MYVMGESGEEYRPPGLGGDVRIKVVRNDAHLDPQVASEVQSFVSADDQASREPSKKLLGVPSSEDCNNAA